MYEKLKFYDVPNDYIAYLQKAEINARGFSRVPNMAYSSNQYRKFVCGIVFKIENINYFAPVTSYKTQKPDNFLIKDKKGKTLSSLRFNYMFPVPLEVVSLKDFKSINDMKYRNLLNIEVKYCQEHKDEIIRLAQRTHKRVMIGKNPGLVHNSCNFKLLEQKCQEYSAQQIQEPSSAPAAEPILPNQIPTTGSQGFGGQGFGGLS